MTNQEIKSIIFSGCKFKYESYDFKGAKQDFLMGLGEIEHNDFFHSNKKIAEYMPISLKDKYKVLKIGKIWNIQLDSNGFPWRIQIGASPKYAKSFYAHDLFKLFHPIACH